MRARLCWGGVVPWQLVNRFAREFLPFSAQIPRSSVLSVYSKSATTLNLMGVFIFELRLNDSRGRNPTLWWHGIPQSSIIGAGQSRPNPLFDKIDI
jgi:hypothetical protein